MIKRRLTAFRQKIVIERLVFVDICINNIKVILYLYDYINNINNLIYYFVPMIEHSLKHLVFEREKIFTFLYETIAFIIFNSIPFIIKGACFLFYIKQKVSLLKPIIAINHFKLNGIN